MRPAVKRSVASEPIVTEAPGRVVGLPLSVQALERLFVWGVWAAMTGVALVCIARYGRNMPLAEDWTLIAAWTGHEPNLLQWLWSQNNEHRVPLGRLLLLGLLHLTGGDFRAGMVGSTLLLAGVSAVLMQVATALRGATRWTDAIFPVLLLHLGNWDNLVWGWQLQFTSSVFLTLMLLAAILRMPAAKGPFWPATAAVALVLLPLSGANGLIVTLGMAPWALYVGWTAPRTGAGLRVGPALLPPRLLYLGGAALLGVALVGLYFVGYHRPTWFPPNPGLLPSLKAAAKIAAMGFGPGVFPNWAVWIPLTGLFFAAGGLALGRGLLAAWRSADARTRSIALGLACFAAASVVLTLAIGWGRAGLIPKLGLPSRYAVLAAPALFLAWLAWELYLPRRQALLLQAGLLAAAVLVMPANVADGFHFRDWYLAGTAAVERDIAAGVPRDELVRRHGRFLLHWDAPLLSTSIARLRETGRGPFRTVRDAAAPPAKGREQ